MRRQKRQQQTTFHAKIGQKEIFQRQFYRFGWLFYFSLLYQFNHHTGAYGVCSLSQICFTISKLQYVQKESGRVNKSRKKMQTIMKLFKLSIWNDMVQVTKCAQSVCNHEIKFKADWKCVFFRFKQRRMLYKSKIDTITIHLKPERCKCECKANT